MANATELDLVDAIVAAINAATWSLTFRASRSYRDVDVTMEELDTLHVDVIVPQDWSDYQLESRGTDQATVAIDIAIRKRFGLEQQNQAAGGVQETEVDRLYTLAIDMARYFSTDRFEGVEANWNATDLVQAYDSEQLINDRQFTAVITLEFLVHRAL